MLNSVQGLLHARCLSEQFHNLCYTCFRLTHCHHLSHALLFKGDLNCGGHAVLGVGHVAVGADLIVNNLNGLHADGPGDVLALLLVHDPLDHQVNWHTLGLKGRGADLHLLHLSDNGAVVFGCMVGRGRMVVGRSGYMGHMVGRDWWGVGRFRMDNRGVGKLGVVDRLWVGFVYWLGVGSIGRGHMVGGGRGHMVGGGWRHMMEGGW